MKSISISPYAMPGIRKIERALLTDSEITESIIDKICCYFEVTDFEVRSKKRSRKFVVPRQWCMFFIKRKTGLALKEIAYIFNHRHHTTVMHSVRLINDQLSLKQETSFQKDFINLIEII